MADTTPIRLGQSIAGAGDGVLAMGWVGGGLASLNGDAGGYFYAPATAGRAAGSVASPWPLSWGGYTPAAGPPSVVVAPR